MIARAATFILWAVLATIAILGLIGCQNPVAPARVEASAIIPLHHNIPATMPDGTVVWVCETQPRAYTPADGRSVMERDHYISWASCPAVPIP